MQYKYTNPFQKLVNGLLSVAVPTFGETVEWRPCSGGRFRFKAVFDSEFQQTDPNTEVVISSNRPRIGVRLKDVPGIPQQDDLVYIQGTVYKVNEIQEDGQGGAVFWLTKQNEQET